MCKSRKTGRKGLVLEGGGAKGAYAFGWLLEFAARGVHFDAVAGTSVGALNAVLWSSDQIVDGERVWRSISEETTLAFRKPRWLWSILLIPYGVHRVLGEKIDKIDDKFLSSYSALLVATIIAVPIVWLGTEIVEQTIVMGAILINPPSGLGYITTRVIGFIQLWLVLCGVMFTMLSVMAPGTIEHTLRFSWRSSNPLRKTIEQIVATRALAIPTYATVAEYRLVCDPDRLRFFRGKVAPRGFWTGYQQYTPIYVPLHKVSENRLARLVLASASLPCGITLPVRDEGRLLVDGGVIDNSPVLPLISDQNCDLIVVVKLRPSPPITNDQLRESYHRLNRRQLAAALAPEEASQMRARGETLTVSEPAVWPELETVAPSRPLGSLLSNSQEQDAAAKPSALNEFRAMLSFEPTFVDRLIALGRADASATSPAFWRRLGASDTT